MFLQSPWYRKVFCIVVAMAYSTSAAKLVLHGALVQMLAALVIGTLIGLNLRPWAQCHPLIVTVALLIVGITAQSHQAAPPRYLIDMLIGAALIYALWPSSDGKKRKMFTASVKKMTKRWSRAIPIG